MPDEREPLEARQESVRVSEAAAPARSATSAGVAGLLRGDPRAVERDTLLSLQRSAGNSAVLGLLRAVAPPAQAESEPVSAALLVADDGGEPGPAQMRQGAFLDAVEAAASEIAERELAWTIYRVAGCPWIDHWIGHYRARPPEEVEAAIRRYAPVAASAASAQEYLQCVAQRVTDSIRGWQATGQLPDAAAADAPPGVGAAVGAVPPVPATAPATVARATRTDLGPGRPLEPGTRGRMDAAFGADFSGVRLHTGPAAQAVADQQHAHALAIGHDIAFAAGRYVPGTPVGDALLAHELAHVMQQTGVGGVAARIEDPALESDADLAALDAVAALHLSGGRERRAAAARRGRPGLQRCGDEAVDVPALEPARPYAEIVTELQGLRSRKEAVLAGAEREENLSSIQARIEEIGAELRQMGVRLETAEIMDRLAVEPSVDLLKIGGQIVRTPPGPAFKGQKLAFQAVLDYVPPGRLVEYAWRWHAGGRENLFYTGRRGSEDRLDLGSGFWSFQNAEVEKAGGMEVVAYVYLGEEEQPAGPPLKTGWIEFTGDHPETYALKASQTATIVDAPVTIEFADWAPRIQDYWIDWDVDGKRVASDQLVLNRKFGTAGARAVTAHVHRRGDSMFRSRGEHVTDVAIDIDVQDPEAAAERVLGHMEGAGAPVSTKELEASLERSIKDIERRVAEGGEQREFWVERLKGERKRLAKLREHLPDVASAEALPTDPAEVAAGHAYNGPVKAVLILPSGGGPQVLNLHLRAWQADGVWRARLVDLTSADVYAREGEGSTALDAYREAFRGWMDGHPYPRGAKVRYQFSPPGWTLPTTFNCRDTPWEDVKAWVDGILTVGGIVVGGLLLLAPEPTGATKALGYLFITAAAARSVVAIYENLELGIDPLDSRNVVEGLSILTSALGVGGSLLRQHGIRAVSPLVYQAGKWTVVASVAGDAGTIAFIGKEGIAQLRAVQGDPNRTDDDKGAEFLRVAGQLFASGALFFATNKDLLKQGLKPADFVKLDPGARKGASLTTGSRLDLGLELKKAGDLATAERIGAGKIGDEELLERHALLPWLKGGPVADAGDLTKRLSLDTLAAVQDKPVKEVKRALDLIADDAAVERLAAKLKGAGLVEVAPTAGKIRKLHPDTTVELRADGQLRLDDQITLGPAKLDTLGDDAAIEDFLKAVKALKETGSPAALRAKDPAAADLIDKLGKQRWRFQHHLDKASGFLADMGLDTDPLFKSMTDHDRVRLYDMHVEPVPYVSPTDTVTSRDTKRRFADYAMAQKPGTPIEFVNHYQFVRARYQRHARELAVEFERRVLALTSAPTPKTRGAAEKEVRAAMGIGGVNPDGTPQPRNFEEKARADLSDGGFQSTTAVREAEAQELIAPHTEVVKVGLGADKAVEANLRALDAIPMSDAPTAAYHVEKHHNELPPSQQFMPGKPPPAPGIASEADAYFHSAAEVVRDPASKVSTAVTQDGRSKTYTFVRPFKEATPKPKIFNQTVIVLVTPDGSATMLTYIPSKK